MFAEPLCCSDHRKKQNLQRPGCFYATSSMFLTELNETWFLQALKKERPTSYRVAVVPNFFYCFSFLF